MRTTMLATILFLVANNCYAQGELAAYGGLLATAPVNPRDKLPVISPYYSVRVMHAISRMHQLGVGVEYVSLQTRDRLTRQKFQYGSPLVPVYAFVNVVLSEPQGYFYTGLAAGVAWNLCMVEDADRVVNVSRRGFIGGLQVGYVHWLTNAVSFNAEIGMRYYKAKGEISLWDYPIDIFYFPVSAGLRLNL